MLFKFTRRDQFELRGHGADDDLLALDRSALEIANAGKINQMFGRCEPGLHQRDQAVTAGKNIRLLAEPCKQAHSIFHGCRAMIIECAWYHLSSSQSLPNEQPAK